MPSYPHGVACRIASTNGYHAPGLGGLVTHCVDGSDSGDTDRWRCDCYTRATPALKKQGLFFIWMLSYFLGAQNFCFCSNSTSNEDLQI